MDARTGGRVAMTVLRPRFMLHTCHNNDTKSGCIFAISLEGCVGMTVFFSSVWDRYAALQEGNLCWCGNSYGSTSYGNSTLCDYDCSGNQFFKCGGYLRNQIFDVPVLISGYVLDEIGKFFARYRKVMLSKTSCSIISK